MEGLSVKRISSVPTCSMWLVWDTHDRKEDGHKQKVLMALSIFFITHLLATALCFQRCLFSDIPNSAMVLLLIRFLGRKLSTTSMIRSPGLGATMRFRL